MQVQVTTDNHIRGTENLANEVTSIVEDALDRFADQVTRVVVHFTDENGKKSGSNDKRCAIEARLAGLQPIAVTETAEDLDLALTGAVDKLQHAIEHTLGRLHDGKGRSSASGIED
jgi:ribosome-associated translation inhibitor RaiA